MEYVSKTIRSAPGLSQEDALEALHDHPNFVTGTKIMSFRRRENRWVADLLEPKVAAEFPPSNDEPKDDKPGDEATPSNPDPDNDGDDDTSSEGDTDHDFAGKGDSEKGDSKGGEKGEIKALMHLVQSIADALGIAPDAGGLGGPDDLGPGAPPPGGPPAGGPPHGGHGAPVPGAPGSAGKAPGQLPTKLQPGEVLPHQTPIGAPAFASVKEANPMALPIDPSLQVAPNAPVPAGNPALPVEDPNAVPQQMNPNLLALQQQQQIPHPQPVQASMGKAASFTASKPDPNNEISIKEAKANLEMTYGPQGYKVKRIKRQDGHIHALLSVR